MNKPAIIRSLAENYNSFIVYISGLSHEEYNFNHAQKWTAGQQLTHIALCIKPLVQVFGMDPSAIAQTFGSTDRATRTFDELLAEYHVKLQEGGKAPDRFVPDEISDHDRAALTAGLSKMIDELCAAIDRFSEQELDSLLIPHPLLGNLTMREMLYNAIYHVKHHHELTMQQLGNIR